MSWFTEQVEWLKGIFSEEDGKASSRRIIELVISWAFVFSYVRVSLSTQKMEDVPMTWALLLTGILGLKTVDYYFKGKTDTNKTNGNGNGNGNGGGNVTPDTKTQVK